MLADALTGELTVISQVKVFPSTNALMVAVPALTAVTRPLLTVATLFALELHSIVGALSGVGVVITFNCKVLPTVSSSAVLSSEYS